MLFSGGSFSAEIQTYLSWNISIIFRNWDFSTLLNQFRCRFWICYPKAFGYRMIYYISKYFPIQCFPLFHLTYSSWVDPRYFQYYALPCPNMSKVKNINNFVLYISFWGDYYYNYHFTSIVSQWVHTKFLSSAHYQYVSSEH